jgi:hypothetical protein
MLRPVAKLIDRVLVVVGAILCMQLPLFMHQYQHQLIGRVAELHWQMEHTQKAASASGKNLDQYIQKFIRNTDEDISRQGELMSLTQKRLTKFSALLNRLQNASSLTRPFLFFVSIQPEMVVSTMKAFEPGITFTMEAALYAFVGMLLGWLVFHFLRVVCVNSYKKLFES